MTSVCFTTAVPYRLYARHVYTSASCSVTSRTSSEPFLWMVTRSEPGSSETCFWFLYHSMVGAGTPDAAHGRRMVAPAADVTSVSLVSMTGVSSEKRFSTNFDHEVWKAELL